MNDFKQYQRTAIAEMRPYAYGEKLPKSVSISQADLDNGSPKVGDMIARNPKSHNDQWLVAAEYFKDNFVEIDKIAKLIEQQQREIDELKSELRSHKQCIESMQQERDALTAHVEVMRNALEPYAQLELLEGEGANKAINALKQSPQTSLAERDREVRARQARRSFREGVHCAKNSKTVSFEDIQAAEEHANKIRNGEDGDE